jgi:hypothetical protein
MTNVHFNKLTITCLARGSLPLLARRGQHAGLTRIGVKQQPSWWPIQAAGALKRSLVTARCWLLVWRPGSRQTAASAFGRGGLEAQVRAPTRRAADVPGAS